MNKSSKNKEEINVKKYTNSLVKYQTVFFIHVLKYQFGSFGPPYHPTAHQISHLGSSWENAGQPSSRAQ